MAADEPARYSKNRQELYEYAEEKTETIGYVEKEQAWIRINDNELLVLGEHHAKTTLPDVVRAVGTKRWMHDSKGSDPAFVPADDDGTGDRRQRLPAPRGPAVSGQELGQAADDKQRPRRVAMPVVGGDGWPGGDGLTIPDVERDAGRRAVSRVGACGSSSSCGTGSSPVRSPWRSGAGSAARSWPAAATAPGSTWSKSSRWTWSSRHPWTPPRHARPGTRVSANCWPTCAVTRLCRFTASACGESTGQTPGTSWPAPPA